MSATYPWGSPPRVSELNENSTRYDKVLAAPKDYALANYWTAWSILSFVVGSLCFILFCGIVSSKKARKNPFNLYLLYLTIPDFLFSFLCFITCTLNVIHGEYYGGNTMCNFQHFYLIYGISSNAWLNAVIARELYTMLKMSNHRRKYKSPTRKQVTKHAICVYIYCAMLGSFGYLDETSWFPYKSGPMGGLACLPIEQDRASTIFFWLCFLPLFVGIPVLYVFWVCYDVWFRSKLLPPTGKRRILVVYFFRLILVFVGMWFPTLVMLFVAAWLPVWAHFATGTWSHLQAAASVVVSLVKPDIFLAVKLFLTCRCGLDSDPAYIAESEQSQRRTTSATASAASARRSVWSIGSNYTIASRYRTTASTASTTSNYRNTAGSTNVHLSDAILSLTRNTSGGPTSPITTQKPMSLSSPSSYVENGHSSISRRPPPISPYLPISPACGKKKKLRFESNHSDSQPCLDELDLTETNAEETLGESFHGWGESCRESHDSSIRSSSIQVGSDSNSASTDSPNGDSVDPCTDAHVELQQTNNGDGDDYDDGDKYCDFNNDNCYDSDNDDDDEDDDDDDNSKDNTLKTSNDLENGSYPLPNTSAIASYLASHQEKVQKVTNIAKQEDEEAQEE